MTNPSIVIEHLDCQIADLKAQRDELLAALKAARAWLVAQPGMIPRQRNLFEKTVAQVDAAISRARSEE